MLLEKGFYKVNKVLNPADGKYQAEIWLNKEHDIFKGHFPGNPVTPGACMIQIVKEISQKILGFELLMKSTTNVKFMALINPEVNPTLSLDFDIDTQDSENIKVKNTTMFGEVIALKMSNLYSKV